MQNDNVLIGNHEVKITDRKTIYLTGIKKIVSFFCFLIACTQNYCINHLWTFRFENKDIPLSFKLWGKFILGSLVGFAINLSILTVLLNIYQSWPLKVIPQGIGILAGMIFNFIFSNFFIFKKEKSNEPEN